MSNANTIYFKNEYDSQFFKRDIYSFSLPGITKKIDSLDFFKDMPKGLIGGRIPVTDTEVLRNAVKSGFEVLCLMVDLELNIPGKPTIEYKKNIRTATLKNTKEIEDIASKAFSFSRFHKDHALSAMASLYHRVWAENCLNGSQADVVLVSGNSQINGFLALSFNSQTKNAKIILIGVSPDKQRMGIGMDLLNSGIDWAKEKGASKMQVRTEADNYNALSLYLKNSFRIIKLSVFMRKVNDKC